MALQLTRGSVARIASGEVKEQAIVQVIDVKSMQQQGTAPAGSTRFRYAAMM